MKKTSISNELLHLLNGENLETKQHDAMMVLTVSEEGWPHAAMISVGEITAEDPDRMKLALWPETHTTENIERTGKAMLVAIYQGKVHYVRLSLRQLPPLKEAKHDRVRFAAKVVSVKEDTAKYAHITSGIQFQLYDPETVIKRWTETVAELQRTDS